MSLLALSSNMESDSVTSRAARPRRALPRTRQDIFIWRPPGSRLAGVFCFAAGARLTVEFPKYIGGGYCPVHLMPRTSALPAYFTKSRPSQIGQTLRPRKLALSARRGSTGAENWHSTDRLIPWHRLYSQLGSPRPSIKHSDPGAGGGDVSPGQAPCSHPGAKPAPAQPLPGIPRCAEIRSRPRPSSLSPAER